MSEWQNIDHLLLQLNQQLSVLDQQKTREQLVFMVNYLLLNDFNRLVQLLYRVDVNEQKLKILMNEQPQRDAAELIADLLISRQQEKMATRKLSKPGEDISEEEKW